MVLPNSSKLPPSPQTPTSTRPGMGYGEEILVLTTWRQVPLPGAPSSCWEHVPWYDSGVKHACPPTPPPNTHVLLAWYFACLDKGLVWNLRGREARLFFLFLAQGIYLKSIPDKKGVFFSAWDLGCKIRVWYGFLRDPCIFFFFLHRVIGYSAQ